uniref:Uncharacterized protein n=1 Tax=Chromera velia CCMP2878 TaxID=1169474 RepID=A0A0G4HIK6_9ALVE|mmetsp:Transcript_36659/g.72093  ORF Transcript_36659/g.72093 Transcript_36659/m.72093 type:complete len:340 (+) Transcript_36659:166-1185(+)|eukprot:Cvel_27831.t1-p1 / transcript=Cvel_27831.t1 / gene=Cvel_27831 / organism=Chromera_velia_CCMP2878 / gene_product=Retinol dehydrogenase 7, putative / transcript_product=Retinol dehydrogenase 7, putative / location=Cvel_scaffold3537:4270-6413(+) / protein_length=339 / sequence_SO=supercontig / SO=protein_coding / is_pseudo=false
MQGDGFLAFQGVSTIHTDWWKIALTAAAALTAIWYYRYRIRPMFSIETTHEKAVFVTGCDTGFGNMLVKRLDFLGFRVFAGCLSEQSMNKLKAEASTSLTPVLCDVTKEDHVVAAAKTIEAECPEGLFAVVNNAGVSDSFLAHLMRPEDIRRSMEINYMGTVTVNYHFFELVRKAKGRIVNMASICAYFTGFGLGPYCATKFAVRAYSEALRQEVEPLGMKVVIIEPGASRTPLMTTEAQKGMDKYWKGAEESRKKVYADPEEFFNGCKRSFALFEFLAEDPQKVVNAYESALTSAYPRTRYTPTLNSKLLCFFSQLPDFVRDCLAKYVLMPHITEAQP